MLSQRSEGDLHSRLNPSTRTLRPPIDASASGSKARAMATKGPPFFNLLFSLDKFTSQGLLPFLDTPSMCNLAIKYQPGQEKKGPLASESHVAPYHIRQTNYGDVRPFTLSWRKMPSDPEGSRGRLSRVTAMLGG